MAKTSIHIKACDTAGSELHNKRERQLSYIRQDLTHLNESYSYTGQSLAAELKRIQQDVKKHTGRKLQKNAIPLKEGVAVISDTTTLSDLKEFCTRCQKEFGLVPLQIHVHRDEGHTAARQWKPNLHAHIVWRMYNEQGRNVRLSNVDCARMQTILAECLGMERGQASSRKHVDALQYKIEAKTSQIEQLTEEVAELSTTKAAKEATIDTFKTVGAHVVDAITGKTKRKEEGLKGEILRLKDELAKKEAEITRIKKEAQEALNSVRSRYESKVYGLQQDKQRAERWEKAAEANAERWRNRFFSLWPDAAAAIEAIVKRCTTMIRTFTTAHIASIEKALRNARSMDERKNTPVTSGTWPKTRCRAPLQRHGYRRERKTWTCWSSTARNSTKSRNAAGRRTGGCTCNGTIQFLKISAARLPKGVLWLQNHTLHVVFIARQRGYYQTS